MKVSYHWLQQYFTDPLPQPEEVVRLLTMHSFEIEGLLSIGNDFLIDVDVLPNRAHDCLSHRGIAKELSVILSKPLKDDPFAKAVDLTPESAMLSVEIEDEKLCPRYSAAVIRGVKVGPSPEWLKTRLEAIGQRSINNIVDATNYVMFSVGQPLHAFDLHKLGEKEGKRHIAVRSASNEESITTLDGATYALTSNNLLIADGVSGKPLGIAGIKGGKEAEIDASTTDIIVESAHFNPVNVRKTSQQLKLRTDASARFENEPSVELTAIGLTEVVRLIVETAGGEVEGYCDARSKKANPYLLGISTAEASRTLGVALSPEEIGRIFDRLGFSYTLVKPTDTVIARAKELVGVPYRYGASISYDAPDAFDCSGFVAYLFAHAGVRIPRMTVDQFVFGDPVTPEDLQPGDIVFSQEATPGETQTFTRVSDGATVSQPIRQTKTREYLSGTPVEGGVSHCGLYLGDGKVIHASGSGGKGSVAIEELATSKSFSSIVGYRRMSDSGERFVVTVPFERIDLRLPQDLSEEIGRIYGYENIEPALPSKTAGKPIIDRLFWYRSAAAAYLLEAGFSEIYSYALRDQGTVKLANPLAADKNFLRDTLTPGLRESLSLNMRNADLFGLTQVRLFEVGTVFEKDGEHASLCLAVENGKEQKKPTARETIEEAVRVMEEKTGLSFSDIVYQETDSKGVVAEMNFSKAVANAPEQDAYRPWVPRQVGRYKSFSPYPFVLRDIAVWVPEAVSADDVLKAIKEQAGDLLVSHRLFDEYRKDGNVSYAFRLVFQSPDRTLSDDEVTTVMGAVTEELNRQEGWTVR